MGISKKENVQYLSAIKLAMEDLVPGWYCRVKAVWLDIEGRKLWVWYGPMHKER